MLLCLCKVAAWKVKQREAMAQQLALEEESLKRLEAVAAANGGAENGKGLEDDEDDAQWDKPGYVKVGWRKGAQSTRPC